MIKINVFRWGIYIGDLKIVWYDLWNRKIGIEISYDEKCLLCIGFGGER